MSELQPTLSPQGRARREQILALALAEARGRRRRRVAIRVGAVTLLVAALILPVLRLRSTRAPIIAVKPNSPHSVPPSPPSMLVTRIETDPHIIERLSIPPQPSQVVMIGDSELLRELAEAHRPAGLAYVNGKAMLLFRSNDPRDSSQ